MMMRDNSAPPPEEIRTIAFRIAKTFTKDQDEAEDLASDAFISVLEKMNRHPGLGRGAIINAMVWSMKDHLRALATGMTHCGRTRIKAVALDPRLPAKDDFVDELCTIVDFEAAVNRLQPTYRVAFLADMAGFTCYEAAEHLDCSVPAFKNNLHRSRSTLRQMLAA
jgi:DNA-directed RNA polymerase specialized sigma24 family protein